jgi:hypothetical protein
MEQVANQYTAGSCSMMRILLTSIHAQGYSQWRTKVQTQTRPSSLSRVLLHLGLMITTLCLGRSPKEWRWSNKYRHMEQHQVHPSFQWGLVTVAFVDEDAMERLRLLFFVSTIKNYVCVYSIFNNIEKVNSLLLFIYCLLIWI